MVEKEVRESELLFLYLDGTAGVTLSVVLQPNNIADPYQMASYVSFCAFSAFLFREIILHAVLAVGQVILSVIHTGRSPLIPLKNDFSRILNAVLSIQDAYDQDQGIFLF